MNLQMQVVDVTDENAIVAVIEKVQVSVLLVFNTRVLELRCDCSFLYKEKKYMATG